MTADVTRDTAVRVIRSALDAAGLPVTGDPVPLTGGYSGAAFRVSTPIGSLGVKLRGDFRPVIAVRVASNVLGARGLAHGGLVVPPLRTEAGWVLALAWVDGAPLADPTAVDWTDELAGRFGADLGRWLSDVHEVRLSRKRWSDRAVGRYRDKLGRCRSANLVDDDLATRVERLWERSRPALGPVPLCLIHRDLQAGNVLVRDGRFAGVIDFEQARLADPLYDFVKLTDSVFALHPGIGPAALAEYGLDPDAPGTRARLASAFLLEYLSALVYFHKHGNEPMIEVQRTRLRELVTGDTGSR